VTYEYFFGASPLNILGQYCLSETLPDIEGMLIDTQHFSNEDRTDVGGRRF